MFHIWALFPPWVFHGDESCEWDWVVSGMFTVWFWPPSLPFYSVWTKRQWIHHQVTPSCSKPPKSVVLYPCKHSNMCYQGAPPAVNAISSLAVSQWMRWFSPMVVFDRASNDSGRGFWTRTTSDHNNFHRFAVWHLPTGVYESKFFFSFLLDHTSGKDCIPTELQKGGAPCHRTVFGNSWNLPHLSM